MSCLSLYREFRPRTFDEVLGQEHITVTLSNQIASGRVGHAYLFTGSRGVGKTTCARIFARSINCLSPVNGSPCYTCEVCKKLENASNLDITEIDAASNNGVDDARELREKVKYPPIHGKYKVFIIDEVHMLSGSAFNALLKTLEEPPAHAVFILATTESHKLPATILSRVMRFDFRLIATSKIAELVSEVYTKSGKEFEAEAVNYIAALGEGSARDALSVADRCLSITEGKLLYKDVLSLLGAAGIAEIRRLSGFLLGGDISGALASVDTLIKSGKSVGMIAKDLLSFVRDLLVVKTAPDVLEMPAKEKKELADFAKDYSVDLLATVIKIFSAIEAELRYSVSVRTVIETACITACRLATFDLSALEARLERLEKYSGGAAAGTGGNSSLVEQRNNQNLQGQVGNAQTNIRQPQKENQQTSAQQTSAQQTSAQQGFGQQSENHQNKNWIAASQAPRNDEDRDFRNDVGKTPLGDVDKTSRSDVGNSGNDVGKDFRNDVGKTPLGDVDKTSRNDVGNSGSDGKVVGSVAGGQNSNSDLPSARALWGRILTYLRTNSEKAVYNIAAEIGEIRLEERTLKITCGKDNFLAMSSREILGDIEKAVQSFGIQNLTILPELVDRSIDMEYEIKNIKSLIGDTPLRVE